MSAQTDTDVFTDVINSLMGELHVMARSVPTILHLLTNNLDSPILAEIQHISLPNLDTNQMNALLPALAKMIKLTSLALQACKPGPDHFKFLFTECPSLSQLQSLDLSFVGGLYSHDLHLLSKSTTLTSLTSLNLEYCSRMGFFDPKTAPFPNPEGLVALLTSPVLQNLTNLRLGGLPLHHLVHTTVFSSPVLSNLVSLGLFSSRMDVGGIALAALAATTTLVNVTHLNLSANGLGNGMITQLFSPSSLLAKKLQFLDLGRCNISLSDLEVVLKAAPHLTELILRVNPLGPAGAAAIAATMPNLTKLDLADCVISDEGYAALAASTTLTNLRELNLSLNLAAPASIIALVNSPVMANLTVLDLQKTHVGGLDVLTAIAQSPSMSKLQRLDLSWTGVGDEGVLALAQSTTLPNLTWLNFSSCGGIGSGAIKALCSSPVGAKLTYLNLTGSGVLGSSITEALTEPLSTMRSLVELHIEQIGIFEASIVQLLATPSLDQLNVLKIDTRSMMSSTEAMYRARFDGNV